MSEHIDSERVSFDGDVLRLRPDTFDIVGLRWAIWCLTALAVAVAILLIWLANLPWWLGAGLIIAVPSCLLIGHRLRLLRGRGAEDEFVLDLRARELIVPWFAKGRRGRFTFAEVERIVCEEHFNGHYWRLVIHTIESTHAPASKLWLHFRGDLARNWPRSDPSRLLCLVCERGGIRFEEDLSHA